MRKTLRYLMVGSMLVFGTSACADLDIANPNSADAERALSTPDDVLSLIGGSFFNWFYGNYNYFSSGMALSNVAFQHNAPWANAGMEKIARLPRISFINSISDGDYAYMTRSWFRTYRSISAVADGLKSLENEDIINALDEDEVAAARGFAKYMQGLGHAQIAVMYAQGFVVDETTDLLAPQDPMPYDQLMDVAMGYFDEAISLSDGQSWTLPPSWMKTPEGFTGDDLARAAHSMKARYMSMVARTPAEREALDWAAIENEVDQGITSDFVLFMDDNNGWNNDVLGYGQYFGWSQAAYYMYGMADQSGNYQAWESLPLDQKSYELPNGDDVLIVTPDTRFPQGSTIEAQRADQDTRTDNYLRINRAGSETGSTWARPDRGTWRWSWYKHQRGEEYWFQLQFDQPEIRMEEMNLLKAEALYRQGQLGAAADIINETRVAAGLSPTDAAGTNTSCVPKLPDGSCGDLFEMLKWEKRIENTFKGPFGNLWYFDGRGWGDLYKDTFLHLPIPCGEAQVLQLLPCNTYGGPGGEDAAAVSTYSFTGET